MIADSSKGLKISYDWRGMPVEFLQQEPSGGSSHATRLVMMYDGSGRRISKTLLMRAGDSQGWDTTLVTHYTGIGTEVREYKPRNFVRYTDSAGVEHCVSANLDYGGNASTACPLPDTVKAVIPLPHGLGRYALQDVGQVDENGAPQAFEWYLKNHLGSTMLVYGTVVSTDPNTADIGETKAAYDYRAFGEMVTLTQPSDKVTENFTGKERDDETKLNYFGARYLDPMLGMWISVDPKRQFASPYLYAGNGVNPVNVIDPDGNRAYINIQGGKNVTATVYVTFKGDAASEKNIQRYKQEVTKQLNGQHGHYNLTVKIVDFNPEIHKAEMNNVINLTNSPNYEACDWLASSCVTPDFDKAHVYWKSSTHTRVHEFAHLLGLDDKYYRGYMDEANWGKPLKGYDDDNLMVKGLNLKESQIEEMWSPGDVDPAYGYEHNEITLEK